jgi:hypothetical protein
MHIFARLEQRYKSCQNVLLVIYVPSILSLTQCLIFVSIGDEFELCSFADNDQTLLLRMGRQGKRAVDDVTITENTRRVSGVSATYVFVERATSPTSTSIIQMYRCMAASLRLWCLRFTKLHADDKLQHKNRASTAPRMTSARPKSAL